MTHACEPPTNSRKWSSNYSDLKENHKPTTIVAGCKLMVVAWANNINYLRHNYSHSQILGMSSNITKHHNTRKTYISLSLTNIINNCCYTSSIDYQLGQLKVCMTIIIVLSELASEALIPHKIQCCNT